MTYTHADQIARDKERETDDVMFPGGVKQMLGFIYAMDGEIFRCLSWHAKVMILRESFDLGYVRPFSLHKINMQGLEAVVVNGECAGLRQQVEDLLVPGNELRAVLAKFGRDDLEYTCAAVKTVSRGLRERLTMGVRKAQRSAKYCEDLIWHECCCLALYDKRYNITSIASRHSMSQNMVSRDASEAKRYVSNLLHKAYAKIEEKFKDGVVLP